MKLSAVFLTLLGTRLFGGFPDIPDPVGRAGMAAISDDKGRILAVGGANFPDKSPWEGGTKAFHADIWLLDGGKWTTAGKLPSPRAYAAFAPAAEGMILAGGCDLTQHLSETVLIRWDGTHQKLAPLPKTAAYTAFASANGYLWVLGGQETPTSTSGLLKGWRLKLTGEGGWEALPDLPFPSGGRILATAGSHGNRLFVFGGCSLAPGPDGKPLRTYHADGAVLSLAEKPVWANTSPAPLPHAVAAAAHPAPFKEGRFLVIGGDSGHWLGKPPQTHPGQSRQILAYDPVKNYWEPQGEWPEGLATVPAVATRKGWATISGETRPGIRTAKVHEQ